ncbi:LLM class flavin-dependent oxidoreductase [Streptomyces sp. P9(2023)]|uniref:LLM class flavin-dependent oxidoreductase n=1 Tax=Streptomyces sp. P9(2023) TaxID=3064394 RepID=UPI0028F3E8EC|nr:LLM class flavin-dependent oxidoreductase [Streptomyces sp. P9(2023)]MDT9687565.1 LLM class flavin-dependent oxidoreductase [Streptomyces sp. P9(2023)]
MDVGILFDLRNPDAWHRPWADHYARSLEFCEEADRRGAGGVWFTEHHLFEDGYLPQPLVFAAAAAARTRHCTIGTAVVLPNLRKPAQLAEDAAVVDLISGGRLELGVGAGYRVPEYNLFDAEFDGRIGRVEQNIREVRRLWAEGGITPAPLQSPVPVWGGFYGPRGARIAGRLGIGLLHINHAMYEHYLTGLAEGGHDPDIARVSDLLPVILADDPEAAWPRIAPHVVHQMNSYRTGSVEGTGHSAPPLLKVEDFPEKRADDGSWSTLEILTPEEAAVRIHQRTEGLPVEHLIFWASIAGMPDDLVARHIELVSERLPKLLAEARAGG